MNKMFKAVLDLRELEKYANGNNIINNIIPEIKIVFVFVYILFITSIEKYNLSLIISIGIIPISIFFLTEINGKIFLSKLLLPVIFSISLGILNPILDTEIIKGIISLLTLVLKSTFSISMTLLLVSTTPITELVKGFNFLKFPKSIIYLFFLMYRYIAILLKEVGTTMEAYSLRNPIKRGLYISTWGSLIGQIIIRSFNRSETIYQAMLIRGFEIDNE